jgi:hypothetical protein
VSYEMLREHRRRALILTAGWILFELEEIGWENQIWRMSRKEGQERNQLLKSYSVREADDDWTIFDMRRFILCRG